MCKYRCKLNEILMPFTYQKDPNLNLYIFEAQWPQTGPFPTKTRVIWLPGEYLAYI